MRRTFLSAAVVAAVGASALAPATASAESIAYIKEGNVWLSTPDASRNYQVTFAGGYSHVSQADDGTMIALKGRSLHKLSRDGTVLADFETPVSRGEAAGGGVFYGPWEPDISPDGTRVAYGYNHNQRTWDGNDQEYETRNSTGTGYTRPDRLTSWSEEGFKNQSGWHQPSWIDNERVLMTDPGVPLALEVAVDKAGDGPQEATHWFNDNYGGGLKDGEMDRRRNKMAFIGGENDEQLRLYKMNGEPPEFPESCFHFNHTAKLAGPSWSPDGSRLAVADPSGIHVVQIPDFSNGCVTDAKADLVFPGATAPDWGPADVPAPRPEKPVEDTPPQQTPQSTPPQQTPGTKPAGPERTAPDTSSPAHPPAATRTLGVTVPRTSLRTALRKGLLLKVRAPRAGRLSVDVVRSRTRVGRGTAKARRAGTTTVRVRFSRSARRTLAGRKAARLTLRVTLRPASGTPLTRRTTTTLRSAKRR